MTQNTEQKVRTREEQVANAVKFARLQPQCVSEFLSCYLTPLLEEAEARGAAEQRRKDVEGQLKLWIAKSDFLSLTDVDEGCDALHQCATVSRDCCKLLPDDVPLYTRPANVAALEAERNKWRLLAQYETDVAQVAIEKAAALEARVAELTAENAALVRKVELLSNPLMADYYEKQNGPGDVEMVRDFSRAANSSSYGDITCAISWRSLGPIFILNSSDENMEHFSAFASEEEAEKARAALTREGGV